MEAALRRHRKLQHKGLPPCVLRGRFLHGQQRGEAAAYGGHAGAAEQHSGRTDGRPVSNAPVSPCPLLLGKLAPLPPACLPCWQRTACCVLALA